MNPLDRDEAACTTNPIAFEARLLTYTEHMEPHPAHSPPTGGPTKDEVLAIAIQKLHLTQHDIIADIGCGTGKVTLAIAPLVAHIHAIDIRDEAYQWTRAEIQKKALANVTLYQGDAAEILASLTHLDKAFVGGSRNLPAIIARLAALQVKQIVITAVLLDTLNTAVATLQQYEIFHEVTLVQVSKSTPLAGGFMLKPLDPVFIITGGYSC